MLFALRCSLFARKHLNTETRQHINSSLSVPQCPPCLSGKNALRFTLFAIRTKTPKQVNTLTQVLVYLSALPVLVVKMLYALRCSLFARKHLNTETRQQ